MVAMDIRVKKGGKQMKGSLIIIAFFALGIAVGLIPNFSFLIPNYFRTFVPKLGVLCTFIK